MRLCWWCAKPFKSKRGYFRLRRDRFCSTSHHTRGYNAVTKLIETSPPEALEGLYLGLDIEERQQEFCESLPRSQDEGFEEWYGASRTNLSRDKAFLVWSSAIDWVINKLHADTEQAQG